MPTDTKDYDKLWQFSSNLRVTTSLKFVKILLYWKGCKMAQEHKHGAMDTEVQEKTFAGFINWTTKTVIICILALVFIALVNG